MARTAPIYDSTKRICTWHLQVGWLPDSRALGWICWICCRLLLILHGGNISDKVTKILKTNKIKFA